MGLFFLGVVLPLLLIWGVMAFFKRYAKTEGTPENLRRLYEENPIEKRHFRLVSFEGPKDGPVLFIADFEKQPDAVDAAYAAQKQARAEGRHTAYLILNDKAEALEEVDA